MNLLNDSLIAEICKTIKESKGIEDSVRINQAFEKHLTSVFEKIDPKKQADAFYSLDIRMQRNCKEYNDIVIRMQPTTGDWSVVRKKPVSSLTKQQCLEFLQFKKFSYQEGRDETTNVTIQKGIWQDNFTDGSYSRLNFYWINDCEFELSFIESNNKSRKALSRPGDKYRYILMEKKTDHYKVGMEVVGQEQFYTFKIYVSN